MTSGVFVLVPLVLGAVGEKERASRGSEGSAAKMVEAIANRNKPPKIVRRDRDCPSSFPIFPKDYDWKEETRVRKAIQALYQDESEEVWEALVRHAKDERYCSVTYSGNSGDAYIDSVGYICYLLAYERLCCVFQEHLPSLPPHGCPIHLEDVSKDMAAWRNKQKNKSLYQLQIEVCEMALRKLPKARNDDISRKEKALAQTMIEAEITKLKKTKQPYLDKYGHGFYMAYPRDEAKRVREAYETGSLEKFRSGVWK
jgi:hypothetical protein